MDWTNRVSKGKRAKIHFKDGRTVSGKVKRITEDSLVLGVKDTRSFAYAVVDKITFADHWDSISRGLVVGAITGGGVGFLSGIGYAFYGLYPNGDVNSESVKFSLQLGLTCLGPFFGVVGFGAGSLAGGVSGYVMPRRYVIIFKTEKGETMEGGTGGTERR